MRRMRAAPWVESLRKPACHPVSEMTGSPIRSMAIASSDMEICSPVESRTSISRLDAIGLISCALAMRSSVVSPCADTTATTLFPAR